MVQKKKKKKKLMESLNKEDLDPLRLMTEQVAVWIQGNIIVEQTEAE